MSVATFEILEPGLLTTVQDKGRYGYQGLGVPVSGAMDVFALRAGNILLGNDDGAAGLELTALGPRLRFLGDSWIAIVGADLSPVLDGVPVPPWHVTKVSKGSILAFQGAQDGMRAYLTIAGGIDVPVVMGSRSTYLKASIGGLEGRACRAGDVLHTLPTPPDAAIVERGLPRRYRSPSYGHEHELRVILGPQHAAFTPDGTAAFLGSKYSVSIHSDRMGYRLEGPPIKHVSGPDIVSDGIPLGAVQVPGDGQPIILVADRGTTGGYAKIATVIGPDVGRLAQAMPGDVLTFKAITIEEAHAILREQEAVLADIGSGLPGRTPSGSLVILVDGQPYEVVGESGEAVALSHSPDGLAAHASHHVRATVGGDTYEFEVEVQQSWKRTPP